MRTFFKLFLSILLYYFYISIYYLIFLHGNLCNFPNLTKEGLTIAREQKRINLTENCKFYRKSVILQKKV